MSEQSKTPADQEATTEQVEERVSADELRRRQQLGQTPGMFVDPPSGAPTEPGSDATGAPDRR
ncbi:hypothetical protein [Catellatospora sp. NPDC049609]|uniref:hypothetical protein n=1 Tax=Catellatospora sp. NPDC049609 TaxID=3155505 RepID=UPI00343EBA0B